MKNLVILGSTGSIGTQALDINKRYRVYGLSCNTSVTKLVEQVRQYHPKVVAIHDAGSYGVLRDALDGLDVEILVGMEGLIDLVSRPDVDMVLTAVVGNIGLEPTVAAIQAGKDIALANKETLVTAGHLIMPLAKEKGVKVLPVDSEHSAIFQCLVGENQSDVDKIILTASGGAFRSFTADQIRHLKANDALKHPNWQMGPKITIDSATLMNKGLEFIEAKWLFDISPDDIEVLVHPQSIIHSMVQFKDGSVKAQMGVPDMRVPIVYALDYPTRHANLVPKLKWYEMGALTFEAPDLERFPCLALAIKAIKEGGLMPTVLNAANEVLVEAYLKDRIGFYDISRGVQWALEKGSKVSNPSLNEVLLADQHTRELVKYEFGLRNTL